VQQQQRPGRDHCDHHRRRIVALVIFDITWKFSRGSRGPLTRLLAAIVARLTGH
jgi:hypothetical protein